MCELSLRPCLGDHWDMGGKTPCFFFFSIIYIYQRYLIFISDIYIYIYNLVAPHRTWFYSFFAMVVTWFLPWHHGSMMLNIDAMFP